MLSLVVDPGVMGSEEMLPLPDVRSPLSTKRCWENVTFGSREFGPKCRPTIFPGEPRLFCLRRLQNPNCDGIPLFSLSGSSPVLEIFGSAHG